MNIPIYQIIENDIKNQIIDGKLKEGDLILSENQLSELYSVSRMTVRQALNSLVNDGYLYRHKGKGTFVSKRKIEKSIHGVRGFTDEMKDLGIEVRNEVIHFSTITPAKKIQDALFLDEGEEVYYVERIRYGDEIPILFEALYIPVNLYKDLTIDKMSQSFYDYTEKEKRYQISHCLQSIEAQLPNEEQAKRLKITKNTPILKITRNTFLNNGRPFEYVVSNYRSDQYRFVQYSFKG